MKKVAIVMFFLLWKMYCFSQGVYLPSNPTGYGTHVNRILPDSVIHIPEYTGDLSLHDYDSSSQIRINDGVFQYWYFGSWHNVGSGSSDSVLYTLYFDQTMTAISYNPKTGDITVGVDTGKLATKYYVLSHQGTDSAQFQYFVDTVTNDPSTAYTKVLVDTLASGEFADHINSIAIKVGSDWSYFPPDANDKLVVTNPNIDYDIPVLFFVFEDGVWKKTNTVADVGGGSVGGNYDLGSTDNHPTRIIANGKIGITVKPNKKVALNGYDPGDTATNFIAQKSNKEIVVKHFSPAVIYQDSTYARGDSLFGYKEPNGEFFIYLIGGSGSSTDTLPLHNQIAQNVSAIGKLQDTAAAHNTRILNEAEARDNADIKTVAVTGTTTKTVTLTKGDASTITTTFTDETGGGLTYSTTVTATSTGQTVFVFSGATLPSVYTVAIYGIVQQASNYSGSIDTITFTATDIQIGSPVKLTY